MEPAMKTLVVFVTGAVLMGGSGLANAQGWAHRPFPPTGPGGPGMMYPRPLIAPPHGGTVIMRAPLPVPAGPFFGPPPMPIPEGPLLAPPAMPVPGSFPN